MAVVAEIVPVGSDEVIRRCNALIDANTPELAVKECEEHLTRNPDDAQVMTMLVSLMKKAGRYGSAYQIAKRAADLRPDRPEAWNCLGTAAQAVWRLDEAESAYRKASQRSTGKKRATYLNNIASIKLDAGKFKDAEPIIREALSLDPSDTLAQHNLGLSLLAQHKWKEAWPNYSASIGTESRRKVKYRGDEPIWDGTKGQKVVVYGEQGLGDEICAASMLPDVIRDSAKVTIDCDARLEGLFKRSFPEAKVHGTRWAKQLDWPKEDRDIDASIAGFEVGKFYRNSDADFPGTAYLTPDPDRVAMWRGLFDKKAKPVIGIAWSGGTWINGSQNRTISLEDCKPLFDAVDANWVSLQYKDASKEIAGTPVVQYQYGTLTRDYDDTAALVASCDLVLGVQTSVFHLAGALGKEAWVLIPTNSQWRYGEEYTSVPWYKSVKLYRQTRAGWPIKAMAEALRAKF